MNNKMKEINRIHTPYRGDSPYIFISYSHKDSDVVFDIIRQLQMNQYRIWYDEGIDPGTEWDENIAEHVENCGYFIALLSKAYLESSNCKDELNYARELEKPRLLVYLEDVQLPGGMRMRLSRLQAIHKYKYSSIDQFTAKLVETNGLEVCRGYYEPIIVNVDEDIFYKPDLPKANKRLIMMVDTSGSMAGTRISSLNKAICRIRDQIKEKYQDAVAVDILSYNTFPSWVSQSDLPLEASGTTNYGAALRHLKSYGKCIPEDSHCAVVFTTDGYPTDHYEDELHILQDEKWFSTAVKFAVSIGDSTNLSDVCEIVDSPNSVINVLDEFDNVLEGYVLGAVASLFYIEESRTAITGRNICDWNDHDRIDEPVKWNLSGDGTLTVRGFIIPDAYRPEPDVPWRKHREEIKKVVVSQGIRIIGMHTFYDLPNLESAIISHSVTDIRCGAFANCPKLETVKFGRKTFDISDFKQIKFAPANTVIVWPEAFANTAYSEPDSWISGTDYAY